MKIEEPIFLRNLMIYPIKEDKSRDGIKIATVDEVIDRKKGNFYELKNPDVNKLMFENGGDLPVLMIDGEEITGSLQNRIIAMSTITEAHSKSSIPVICAEEGRWREIGGFRTGYCSYPRIRSILVSSFYKKVDTQREVWKEIDRKLTVTKTLSQTSSMHEIYENLVDEVERYLEGFESLNHGIVGFIGAAGGRILGCDIFCSPEVYKKYEGKLMRSYALDAIEYQKKTEAKPEVKGFFKNVVENFDSDLLKIKSGNKRLRGRNFLGQMIFHRKVPLHLSAFPI